MAGNRRFIKRFFQMNGSSALGKTLMEKTVEQNFALLGSTERFVASGQPYLMGLSRKSSIGAATGHKAPMDRIAGSIAGALIAVEQGAQVVRVHDCRQTVDAVAVWRASEEACGRR